MSGFELRPLTLGELLDRAFLLYRRNFWLFAGIMVIPSCLTIPMRFFLLRSRDVPFPWNRSTPQPHSFAYNSAFLLLYYIVHAVGEAATTCAASDEYLGRSSTIREAYRNIRGRFWRAIGVTLSVYVRAFALIVTFAAGGAVAGIGLAAVANPGDVTPKPIGVSIAVGLGGGGFALGLFISARYMLSLPAVLLENLKGRAAIRRSVGLSRGRRGQIFVANLLSYVLYYSAAAIFEGPFYLWIAVAGIRGHLPNWLTFGIAMSGTLGGAIASPLVMIALVLYYYDLRIRKEGFDLQHMMTLLPDTKPADSISLA